MPRIAPPKATAGARQQAPLTIVGACRSPAFFAPWFKNPTTWAAWLTLLRVLFGLPLLAPDLALYRQCTGRTAPPIGPFHEAWLIVGRRGGKSLILALIAVYLACFRDWSPYLAPGERGLIPIIATDRRQARVIFRYIRAFVLRVPALAQLVEREEAEALHLKNGISIEVQTASFRTIRGFTVIAALGDEIAFWRTDEGSANPDSEIIAALRPAMATIPDATLLLASSPYARRGELWNAHRKYWGVDGASVLVWKADTRTKNPTVPQRVIDEAYERDAANAASEFGRDGVIDFRSDIESFVSADVVDAVTVPDRRELLPISGINYAAFVDPAGGSGQDSMTLAIGHQERERIILDCVRERRPPFSPEAVVVEFADVLHAYGIRRVVGDRFGGEWPRERFREHGIDYELADRSKSDLYRDALPLLNSGKAELLDIDRLSAQLTGLERRTARGGKDSIDHAPGAHDDVANVVCGVLTMLAGKRDGLATWTALGEAPGPTLGGQHSGSAILYAIARGAR